MDDPGLFELFDDFDGVCVCGVTGEWLQFFGCIGNDQKNRTNTHDHKVISPPPPGTQHPKMALEQRLDIEIDDINGRRGTTSPRLEIEIVARTTGRNHILVDDLHPETKFRFTGPDVEKTIEGPTATVNAVQVNQFDHGNANRFTATIELSQDDLETIEELREGGDIEVKVQLWIRGRRDNSNDDSETATLDLSEKVIAARWSEILRELGYHENRQFTVYQDMKDVVQRDALASASASMEQAQQKHDLGDYRGAMADTRDAVQALDPLMEDLEEVLDDRKYDDFSTLRGQLDNGFLGGLNHPEERTGIKPALRRDSEFALGVAKSCIRFVSTVLEEELGEEGWPLED